MNWLIWFAALGGFVTVLNSKAKLDKPWKEYAVLCVVLTWGLGLLLFFPVIHYDDSPEQTHSCRAVFDKAGGYSDCD